MLVYMWVVVSIWCKYAHIYCTVLRQSLCTKMFPAGFILWYWNDEWPIFNLKNINIFINAAVLL